MKDMSSIIKGNADIVDVTRFEFDYPFGFFPKIKQSHVTIQVGVSYGKSAYSSRNMTFYDSKCRTCSNVTGIAKEPV